MSFFLYTCIYITPAAVKKTTVYAPTDMQICVLQAVLQSIV